MKILYGVQATGNGHISRSRIMAKYFAEAKVDVTYLFSGRAPEQLFDMECFGDYLYRRGMTFNTKDGKINYASSIVKNNMLKMFYDIYALDVEPYDLIITDFEPITAWAGKIRGKQTLGVGHQYAFGQNTPITGENYLAKMVMKYFAPANQSLGLHWAPYNNNVLPPIIDVNMTKSACEKLVLVYLPFEEQSLVTEILNGIADKKFVQYSSGLSNSEQGNVSLRSTCYQGFKRDLCQASGVICNSGFELISECLHLGLPVLTKPINGQMEQESNALALQELNLADVMQSLDSRKIHDWINNYSAVLQRPIPDVAKTIVQAILSSHPLKVGNIAQSLWRQYR